MRVIENAIYTGQIGIPIITFTLPINIEKKLITNITDTSDFFSIAKLEFVKTHHSAPELETIITRYIHIPRIELDAEQHYLINESYYQDTETGTNLAVDITMLDDNAIIPEVRSGTLWVVY